MKKVNFYEGENGWIKSDSQEFDGVMGRVTTCKGCGYQQKTIMPSRYDTRLWQETHTKAFCDNRKSFNNLMGNPMEKLEGLSIR